MTNLFSIFDPNIQWINLRLNWVRVYITILWIPGIYWLSNSKVKFTLSLILKTLSSEFRLNFKPTNSPGHTHWALRLFLIILLNNVLGLTPYTFTASSHLSFSLSLALVMWLTYIIYRILFRIGRFMAHLVPVGTPYVLIPFMVIIEFISNIIRPITLSVRLAANLVAGHLLITLIRTPIVQSRYVITILLLRSLYILIILESAVAFIQAYVFRMLRTLYLREVNNLEFNY